MNKAYAGFALALVCHTSMALADGALNLLLRGDYRITGHQTCVQSVAGFTDPPALQPLDLGTTVEDYWNGTISFDGNGNAVEKSKGLFKLTNTFPPETSSGTFEITCDYRYRVSVDRSFALEGKCESRITRGAGVGLVVTVADLKFAGEVERFGGTLVAGSADDHIINLLTNGAPLAKRVCGQTFTGVKIR